MSPRFAVLLLALVLAGCTLRPPPTSSLEERLTSPSAAPSRSLASSAEPSASVAPASPPAPTPDPAALEVLELEATGCPGGVALDWSPTTDAEFHHYTALRSLEPDVATAYPPIAPAVDWGDSYATDRFVTSAVDATLIPSEATFHYRVMAYDARNRPLAASPVRRTRPSEIVDLGAVVLEARADGVTHLDWGLFGGLGRCFSSYRVLVGPRGSEPGSTLTVISAQSLTEVETDGLHAGATTAVRVEAVRSTTLGSFVVARTEIATYTAP